MNLDNYHFVVVAFDGKTTASAALKDIKQLKKEGSIKYKDAVAAYKKNGKVKLDQAKETKGIFGGGIAGLLVGALIGGPIVGAAIGALAGGAAFGGMRNKDLKEAASELDDDQSALFVVVEEAEWDKVASRLPEYEAVLHREVIPVEVITSLETASTNYEMANAVHEELTELD